MYAYLGEATTTSLASYYDSPTLTKSHSSLVPHPAPFACPKGGFAFAFYSLRNEYYAALLSLAMIAQTQAAL